MAGPIKGAKVQIVVTCEPHFYGRRLGNFCNISKSLRPGRAGTQAAAHEEFIVRAVNGQGRGRPADIWASRPGSLLRLLLWLLMSLLLLLLFLLVLLVSSFSCRVQPTLGEIFYLFKATNKDFY